MKEDMLIGCEGCAYEFYEGDPEDCPLVNNDDFGLDVFAEIIPHLKNITEYIGCIARKDKRLRYDYD